VPKRQLGWVNLPHSSVLRTPETSKHRMSSFHGISPWEKLKAVEEKTWRRGEFWDENGRLHETQSWIRGWWRRVVWCNWLI